MATAGFARIPQKGLAIPLPTHGVTRRSAADYSWIQPEISSKCGTVSSTTVFLDPSLDPGEVPTPQMSQQGLHGTRLRFHPSAFQTWKPTGRGE